MFISNGWILRNIINNGGEYAFLTSGTRLCRHKCWDSAQKNELERSANLTTKTRVNIEFYGHINKIFRQRFKTKLRLGVRRHMPGIHTVYRSIENRCTRKWHNTHLTRRLEKTHFISENLVQIGEFWLSLGHTCIGTACVTVKMSSARNLRAINFWTRALRVEAPVTESSSFQLLVPPLADIYPKMPLSF